MKKQIELQKKFLEFCKQNRDKRIPSMAKYEKRHFLTSRQIATFANQQQFSPAQGVIAYFSKTVAVEQNCECRIFEPRWREENPEYARISNQPEWMRSLQGPNLSELLEIEFSNNR